MTIKQLLAIRTILMDRMDYYLYTRDDLRIYELYKRKYHQINQQIQDKYRIKEQVNKQMALPI